VQIHPYVAIGPRRISTRFSTSINRRRSQSHRPQCFPSPRDSFTIEPARISRKQFDGKRFFSVANTKKIEDKTERKKLKRASRKKAAPKAKRTTPRGSNKKKVKKLARGQSKR
jgi:hypothetical protein